MISPQPMMTAFAFFQSFRSLNFPLIKYFRRERMPLGISVTKVILDISTS
jgi:hypothetical protein